MRNTELIANKIRGKGKFTAKQNLINAVLFGGVQA